MPIRRLVVPLFLLLATSPERKIIVAQHTAAAAEAVEDEARAARFHAVATSSRLILTLG